MTANNYAPVAATMRCCSRWSTSIISSASTTRLGTRPAFRPIPREFVATLGERIRRCVSHEVFDVGQPVSVTASIGLAEYPLFRTGGQQLGWEQMLELADAALYWVKENGRDGWAALRPTAETDLDTLIAKLRLGAQALIDRGQLEIISSRVEVEV